MRILRSFRHGCAVAAAVLLALALCGCTTFQYKYVLEVRCIGRKLPNDPSPGSYVGLTPPVKVSLTYSAGTKEVDFDPMGETKTLNFAEEYRVMIDGNSFPRGFKVRIERPTYKEWSADYSMDSKNSQCLMLTEGGGGGGSLIRLDSVVLEPLESEKPSRRILGGPVLEKNP
jgi:hypothetical protein